VLPYGGVQQFGKYQLLERLAVGGMAEVFRGKAVGAAGFEKDLAIKRILPQFSEDEDFVRMFIDEARLAAQLQHGNIVQIFDFDEAEGSYYIAMELVEGCDLRKLNGALGRQSRRLPVGVALYIAVETLKGLQYAHGKKVAGRPLGLVHRDVSPHNILLSRSGEVKLSDFGIAKAHARATATRSGIVKGKLGYMAPEQIAGQPIDARTDLFAVGVVLYEMLTGERLFQGDSEVETMALVQRCQIPPPQEKNPEVTLDVEAATLKLLAADPGARFQSAGDAIRALSATPAYSYDPDALAELVTQVAPPAEPAPIAGGTRALDSAAAGGRVAPSGTRLLDDEGVRPAPGPLRTPSRMRREAPGSGSRSVQPVVVMGGEPPAPSPARWVLGPLIAAATCGLTFLVGARVMPHPVSRPPLVAPPSPPAVDAAVAAEVAPAPTPRPRVEPEPEPAPTPTPEEKKAAHDRKKLTSRTKPASHVSATTTAAPQTPQPPGKLSVFTRGTWADVFIDGKKVGTTPLRSFELPAGHHTLELRNDEAGARKSVSVNIRPNEAAEIREELK